MSGRRITAPTTAVADVDKIKAIFKTTFGSPVLTFEAADGGELPAINVGVILSGGQAPGGHNVIAGLYDGLKSLNKGCRLYGFLKGPDGLVKDEYVELTDAIIDAHRNTGGFDMIGSGRTKLETDEQFEAARRNCEVLGISALVIIGGDDSNTNACSISSRTTFRSRSSAARRPSTATSRTSGSRRVSVSIPPAASTANSSATSAATRTPPRNTGTSSN